MLVPAGERPPQIWDVPAEQTCRRLSRMSIVGNENSILPQSLGKESSRKIVLNSWD